MGGGRPMSAVRTKTVGLPGADHRSGRTHRSGTALGDPDGPPFWSKATAEREDRLRRTPTLEIPTVSDEITQALAQLVRDRWAAEGRGLKVARSTLWVMAMRQG